ncbi:MAG: Rieske 2Fe-2S domain-containing protein [Chromatiales bacterium]
MSDALDYLLRARPEAMGAYFRFLRESGQHLDPRTRALISVITKVATQTEDGFRQYLSRALRAGLSANEILDGLLTAFPALGLAKIIWAIDLIVQMDIPEFRLEALQEQPRWHEVGDMQAMGTGQVVRVACDDRELFIRRDGQGYAVYDSRCPHQVTNIPELALKGERLICPKHGWVFDITSGACLEKGDRPLRNFESRVEDGKLFAYW